MMFVEYVLMIWFSIFAVVIGMMPIWLPLILWIKWDDIMKYIKKRKLSNDDKAKNH